MEFLGGHRFGDAAFVAGREERVAVAADVVLVLVVGGCLGAGKVLLSESASSACDPHVPEDEESHTGEAEHCDD